MMGEMEKRIATSAVTDLSMMLRRMIWQARKETGDSSMKALAGSADQLLARYGLGGSPLRDDPASSPPALSREAIKRAIHPFCFSGKNSDAIVDAVLALATHTPAQASLPALWRAIVDHTRADEMFWIGEILLNEITKETGYDGAKLPGHDETMAGLNALTIRR